MGDASEDVRSAEERAREFAWFDAYTARTYDLPLRCPCCRCRTLTKRDMCEICEVCFWEDDGLDDGDADVVGGPNGALSLREARANYLRFGACEEQWVGVVRPLRPEELPE